MRFSSRLACLLCLGLLAVGCGDPDSTPSGSDAGPVVTSPDRDAGPIDPDRDAGARPMTSPVACDGDTPEALIACVDQDRYADDVGYVTGFRDPGSSHWMSVADYAAMTFTSLGMRVERHDYGSGVNLIGVLDGDDRAPEQVVIGAHYDHFDDCAGADDNATGVAGVIEMARVLSSATHRRTLVAALWDEEERGLIGSEAWVDRATGRGEHIVVAYNFDMIGYASDEPGSQVVPDLFRYVLPDQYAQLASDDFRGDFVYAQWDRAANPYGRLIDDYAEGLGRTAMEVQIPSAMRELSALQRSDHASFWNADIPAVFVGDTGDLRNPNYHCRGGEDDLDTLDHAFAADLIRASVGSVARALAVTEPAPDPGPTVTSCVDFCSDAPRLTPAQLECLGAVVDAVGGSLSDPSCANLTSPSACLACASAERIEDEACEALAELCL